LSTPAISTPAISSVIAHSCNVHPRFFHAPSMSTPAISVNSGQHCAKSANTDVRILSKKTGALRVSVCITVNGMKNFKRQKISGIPIFLII